MRDVNPNDRKYNFLLNRNKGYMNYTALSTNLGNRKVTYEELHDSIEKYARILYKKGIRAGDKVAVCGHNTIETIFLLYALDVLGAELVGLNALDNKEKIREDLELTRPKMVVSVDMAYSNFRPCEKALDFSTLLYSTMESCDNKMMKVGYNAMQLVKGNFKLHPDNNIHHLANMDTGVIKVPKAKFTEDEVTDIIFTGGSTGVHKGAMLAGEGLNYVIKDLDDVYHLEPGMIHLGNVPVVQMVYGRMIMHYALCNNLKFDLTLKAMPEDFYDELVRTQAHGAVGGPPHMDCFIEKDRDGNFVRSSKLKKGSLPNLKYVTSGGEAIKTPKIHAIDEGLDYCGASARLGNGLGATEAWSVMMVNNRNGFAIGSLGNKLSSLDVKLLDPETGLEGDEGLLFVSGKSVMKGYYNNPEETRKVMQVDEHGKVWCNLNDIVKRLPNDEYQFVGRKKRNFVCGVENIYPEQLEGLLCAIPEIREIVVTPISDDVLQFVPRYHISVYDEHVDLNKLEAKIEALVKAKLSPSWLPGYIEYTTEPLVKMTNTKIDIGHYKKKDIIDEENGTLDIRDLGGKQIEFRPVS